MSPTPTWAAFASCQPGLEPMVAAELSGLGATPRPLAGGVAFEADLATLMRAGLRLGSASHVLIRLAEFPCRALGELERKARSLPWADWLSASLPVVIRATSHASRVFHTGAIAERVANAIGATVGATTVRSPNGEAAQLRVRFRRDVCTISLDTGTTPLYRRGYRLATAKAPLREDLAHAVLQAADHEGGLALFDPFCGSGTIAIEAAARARGLPPGRLRPPPLSHLPMFDEATWEAVRTEREPRRAAAAPIRASDRDAGAIALAQQNAERAGVAEDIDFTCCAFTAHPWFATENAPEHGLVASNPPFGRRVGRGGDLRPLYQSLGRRIADLGAGWRTILLASDVRLARRTGLDLAAAFTTRHGGISVTALAGAILPT